MNKILLMAFAFVLVSCGKEEDEMLATEAGIPLVKQNSTYQVIEENNVTNYTVVPL